MPFASGQKLTAAQLNAFNQGGTTLTNDTNTATLTAQQWGTETVSFTNPGMAIKVVATVTGSFSNATDASTNASCRVGISFDGGSTWDYGPSPAANVGTADGSRTGTATQHYRTGTPTGNVVIRAEATVSDTSISMTSGFLTAQMMPA